MIDHMGIRPANIESSRAFYTSALKPLGITTLMEVMPRDTGGYHGIGYGNAGKPFFWLSGHSRHSAADRPCGNGIHIAFAAGSRASVDAFHAAALAAGGRNNGLPGIRAHYHAAYYAAFVIDPDGVNVEAVCQKQE